MISLSLNESIVISRLTYFRPLPILTGDGPETDENLPKYSISEYVVGDEDFCDSWANCDGKGDVNEVWVANCCN